MLWQRAACLARYRANMSGGAPRLSQPVGFNFQLGALRRFMVIRRRLGEGGGRIKSKKPPDQQQGLYRLGVPLQWETCEQGSDCSLPCVRGHIFSQPVWLSLALGKLGFRFRGRRVLGPSEGKSNGRLRMNCQETRRLWNFSVKKTLARFRFQELPKRTSRQACSKRSVMTCASSRESSERYS